MSITLSPFGKQVKEFFPNWKHSRCAISLLMERNLARKCVTGFQNGKQEFSQIRNTRFIFDGGRGEGPLPPKISRHDLVKMPFSEKNEMIAQKNMFCNRATYTLLMIFIFVNCWKYPLKSFYHRAACI